MTMSVKTIGLRELAVVAGLLPFAFSFLVHTGRPSVLMAIPPKDRPALVFHQYQIDLGRIQPTSEVRGTFVFENRGQSPVTIEKVTPSCGCLQPQLSKEELAVGETASIILRMQPANEMPGQKEYFADIAYSDPQPRTVRVTFRLELPEQQMSVRPRALVVYQNTNEPTTHELSVSDTRPRPANILNAATNSNYAKVELLDVQEQPEFGRVTQLKVTISPDLPPGRHEATITIETDDPRSPVLRVPMLLHGPAAGE